jgi:glycerol uptake facilitator-like aquaporin
MHAAIRGGAELIGTALLVAAVIGSGIMAEAVTSDVGLRLLLNQLSTILGLGVLIAALMPVSGAHINPVVTFALFLRRALSGADAVMYVLAQLLGSLGGVVLAHLMFGEVLISISGQDRLTTGTFVGEVIATAGLIAVIILLAHRGQESVIPLAVPAWIGSAFFFTSSTSFANPAVTLGRIWTDSFTGIAPLSGLGFMAAQLVGMALALALVTPLVAGSKEIKNGW